MTEVEWIQLDKTLDSRFRLQQAALLAYVCATLPTRFSRRVVRAPGGEIDPSAMPVEIWITSAKVEAETGAAFAFVWLVRHEKSPPDSKPLSIVGFLRLDKKLGLVHCDLAADEQLPKVFEGLVPVRFSDQFWRSDLKPLAAATNHERDKPVDAERIRLALQHIDDAFSKTISTSTALSMLEFKLVRVTTDPAASGWRLLNDTDERQCVAELLERKDICNFRLEAAASKRMVLLERKVPFYKGCRLYRIIDMRGPRSRFTSFVLHEESQDIAPLYSHLQPGEQSRNRCTARGELFIDKFRSCSHERNSPVDDFHRSRFNSGELCIDASSLGAYLRFYCEFMHGQEEVFSIVESAEDIRWLSPASARQRVVALKHVFNEVLMPVAFYQPRFADPAASFTPQHSAEDGASSSQYAGLPAIYCRVYVNCGRYLFVAGIAVKPDGNFDRFEGCALHSSALPIHARSDHIQSGFVLRANAF